MVRDVATAMFMGLRDLGELTGQSVSTLKIHAADGRIPALKIGGRWKVPTSYLDQLEREAYDSSSRGAAS